MAIKMLNINSNIPYESVSSLTKAN